ncbi:hypothetical protein FQN52_005664, partial [Onygenales sp. PD_12]
MPRPPAAYTIKPYTRGEEIIMLGEDKEEFKDVTPVKAEKLLEELIKLLHRVDNEIDMEE